MTALALLTGRLAPGVWRVEVEPLDLQDLATGLGWTVRRFAVVDDKAAVIANLGAAVEVPDYVRANWDSIADGLKDIEPPTNGHLLILADASTLPDLAEQESTLTSVLNEAVVYWRRFGVTVQIVWIGDGSAPLLSAVAPIRASRRGRTARTGRMPDR